MKSKSVIIICGDPKSTFNEILIKTLNNKVLRNIKIPIIIVGSKQLLENEFKKLKIKVNLQTFDDKMDDCSFSMYVTAKSVVLATFRKDETPRKKNF